MTVGQLKTELSQYDDSLPVLLPGETFLNYQEAFEVFPVEVLPRSRVNAIPVQFRVVDDNKLGPRVEALAIH